MDADDAPYMATADGRCLRPRDDFGFGNGASSRSSFCEGCCVEVARKSNEVAARGFGARNEFIYRRKGSAGGCRPDCLDHRSVAWCGHEACQDGLRLRPLGGNHGATRFEVEDLPLRAQSIEA